jgi:hypothetical protein
VDIQTQQRIEHNEARFRELNDQQLAAGEAFHGEPPAGVLTIMCECATMGCEGSIEVPLETYREVRSHENQFLVLPDHVIPAVEQVQRDCDTYWIVVKTDMGAEVAPTQS